MQKISDYKIHKKIDEYRGAVIYEGQKEDSEKKVIIKILKAQYPALAEIARFNQEYDIIKNLDIDGIIKTHEVITDDRKFTLILDDYKGYSLKSILKNETLSLEHFLNLAIQLSETLGHLHKANIIHKNINSHNIYINTETHKAKLTNFGIESEVTHENQEIYNPEVIIKILPYISPEQTGRMNRSIDYRSDLYSLGVTFYEILTGNLPFESEDPMEIIHSHIARMPISPHDVNPSVPIIISDIIMRLLQKTAEKRYQNSFGLMADFQICLEQLKTKNTIKEFSLGTKDISLKFNIPQKLYGREKEIEILMSAFDNVCKDRKEILTVTGYSGIGKSALINEIHKPIVARRGYFISGKYDQFRRDVPYSSIIQAFQILIRQILSESKEKILEWKKELLKQLGSNAKIITDVIPEVELIIGAQLDVIQLGPEEAQHRFNIVFENFIKVFTKKEHPLVLFLDDLQWIDSASIKLIERILTNNDIKYFLFIGSYRDNEVSKTHILYKLFEDVEEEKIKVTKILLNPLTVKDLQTFISNFLRCEINETLTLAELVHKKTGGNPFFVNQFIKTLYEERLIELDEFSNWKWDINKLESMQITDNVVTLLAGKIIRLSEKTQEILKICACIGNRFDLETLSIILGKNIDETLEDLTEGIDEQLVGISNNIYVFHHDRIQEAVYSLIKENKKDELHFKIGKLILEKSNKTEIRKKLFYIVNQLNFGIKFLSLEKEKIQLARLNLIAGRKARAAAAYLPAYNYFKNGIDLLGDNSWKTKYNLTLDLYRGAAESAYLNTNYSETERFCNEIFVNAKEILDKEEVYIVKILTCMAQNKLNQAIEIGSEFLDGIGVRIPKKTKKYHVLLNLIKVGCKFQIKKTEDLINLPKIKDPVIKAAMRIMATLSTVAYTTSPDLFVLISLKMIDLSLKYGNSEESIYFYATYGIILIELGLVTQGYRFGQVSLEMLKNAKGYQIPRTHFVINAFIRHWKEHANQETEPLFEAYLKSLEVGDVEIAALSAVVHFNNSFMIGKNLELLDHKMSIYMNAIYNLQQKTLFNMMLLIHQLLLNLQGKVKDPYLLVGRSYNEYEMLPKHIAANDRVALFSVYLNKLTLAQIFGDHKKALFYAKEAEKFLDSAIGMYDYAFACFYFCLARLISYDTAQVFEKKQLLKDISKYQKRFKKWSIHAPENFMNKYYLIEAEKCRILNRDLKAGGAYDKSIEFAAENFYIQEEAIANELAGKFYISRGRKKVAKAYLLEAKRCYEQWGAQAKIKMLLDEYPEIFKNEIKDTNINVTNVLSGMVNPSTIIDLKVLTKALKTIAEENVYRKMLEQTISIAIKFAGAQKGILLLAKEDTKNIGQKSKLFIEAQGSTESKKISVFQSIPADESKEIPQSIINYVMWAKKSVVINDASKPFERIPQLQADPYIKDNGVKSILCMPIVVKVKNEIEVGGLLYLENNLATNTFTEERIEILEIICLSAAGRIEISQKAITDGLTNLYNHDYFITILEQEIVRSERQGKPLSLIMIDIDHFKNFNDRWGHQLGDLVLQKVSHTIKDNCRKSDVVSRYGGEEISILLPETNTKEAFKIAEKMRNEIENLKIEYMLANDQILNVTISLGVAGFPIHAKSAKTLIRKADEALYISKNEGRNRTTLK